MMGVTKDRCHLANCSRVFAMRRFRSSGCHVGKIKDDNNYGREKFIHLERLKPNYYSVALPDALSMKRP